MVELWLGWGFDNIIFHIKEEEKHIICLFQCKYDYFDVYLRGSAAVNMFSISNISKFSQKRGVCIFQKLLKFTTF